MVQIPQISVPQQQKGRSAESATSPANAGEAGFKEVFAQNAGSSRPEAKAGNGSQSKARAEGNTGGMEKGSGKTTDGERMVSDGNQQPEKEDSTGSSDRKFIVFELNAHVGKEGPKSAQHGKTGEAEAAKSGTGDTKKIVFTVGEDVPEEILAQISERSKNEQFDVSIHRVVEGHKGADGGEATSRELRTMLLNGDSIAGGNKKLQEDAAGGGHVQMRDGMFIARQRGEKSALSQGGGNGQANGGGSQDMHAAKMKRWLHNALQSGGEKGQRAEGRGMNRVEEGSKKAIQPEEITTEDISTATSKAKSGERAGKTAEQQVAAARVQEAEKGQREHGENWRAARRYTRSDRRGGEQIRERNVRDVKRPEPAKESYGGGKAAGTDRDQAAKLMQELETKTAENVKSMTGQSKRSGSEAKGQRMTFGAVSSAESSTVSPTNQAASQSGGSGPVTTAQAVRQASRSAAEAAVKQARFMRNGDHSRVSIRLNPPELGKMKVDIDMVQDKLNIDIQVENAELREALQQNVQQLERTLREGRYDAQKTTVSDMWSEDHSGHARDGMQHGDGHFGDARQQQHGLGNVFEDGQEDAGRRTLQTVSESGINCLV